MKADTIIFNKKIHTLDRHNPLATALALKDGKFIVVTDDTSLLTFLHDNTQRIDCISKRQLRE